MIRTGMNAVSPGYFAIADIPILAGRDFANHDVAGTPLVAVINETLARQVWPGQDPIGRTLPYGDDNSIEIVGVAGTSTYYELGEEPHAQAYVSLSQFPQPAPRFLIRTAGEPLALLPEVRRILRQLEPELVFRWTTTMEAVVEEEIDRYQVSAVLVSIFGAIALLMVAAGLYGTISFLVARRTRDIGVRMALGADGQAVANAVLGFGLRLTLAGIALGLLGSVALRRFAESLLYQVPIRESGAPVGSLHGLAHGRRPGGLRACAQGHSSGSDGGNADRVISTRLSPRRVLALRTLGNRARIPPSQ